MLSSPNDQAALLGYAAELQDSGDIAAAAWLFRRALGSVSADFASHARCARACAATGDVAEALRATDLALAEQPGDPEMLALRGGLLWCLGRVREAIAAWRNAAAADPSAAAPRMHLGLALMEAKRQAEALDWFREAARLTPDPGPVLALADALSAQGQAAEAAALLAQAPDTIPVRQRRIEAALTLGDAEAAWREAATWTAEEPRHTQPWHALARAALALGAPERVPDVLAVLENGEPEPRIRHAVADGWQRAGDLARAEAAHAAAIEANPTDSRGISRKVRGHLLAHLGRIGEGEAELERAEAELAAANRRFGDRADISVLIAAVQLDRARPSDALATVEAALVRAPDHPELRHWRAQCLIAVGREAEGWPDRLWRYQTGEGAPVRPHPAPPWTGEEMPEGVLLLGNRGDGLGDFLQFCRFVPFAAQRARVVLQAPRALLPLARSLPGPERVVSEDDGLVDADRYCQIADLPSVIGLQDDGIPALVPYLKPDPVRRAEWQARLAGLPGLRVGIAWQGNRELNWDFARSIAPERLAALADTPGVSFVSLQRGETAPGWMHDIAADLTDFGETAGAMESVDLVIAVDSAVVHLAGALGRPVWLLNRFNSDFRWQFGREDSDWYPSLRIFRQPRVGDWDAVLAAVRAALEAPDEAAAAVLLPQAATAHQAGELLAAERGYHLALSRAPHSADALHLLALALLQRGEAATALARADQAIRWAPERADFHDTRANALRALGRIAEAVEDWRLCLSAAPDQPRVWFNLGAALAEIRRFEDAAACQREALTRDPELVPAQFGLANALIALGRLAEAEEWLRALLARDPDNPSALNNLGLLLRDLGRPEEALAMLGRKLALEPQSVETWTALTQIAASSGHPEAVAQALASIGAPARDAATHVALGHAWVLDGQLENAAEAFATAARLDPDHGEARRLGALVLAGMGRLDEAATALSAVERRLRNALLREPARADIAATLAIVLFDQARPAEAVNCLDAALRLEPRNDNLRWLRGECLIAAGRDAEGWPERFARTRVPGARRPHPAPLWDGSAAPGRTLLLSGAGDGFGDFLMFSRFVALAAERARVVLQVPPPLLRVAATLAGPERVVSTDEGVLPADLFCHVSSLPSVLVEAIPGEVPYLRADPSQVGAWRQRLSALPGLRVGIAWHGNRVLNTDFLRSIPPEHLAALADTPGVSFVSVLPGEPAADWITDVSADLHDFADTAALMMALDLVVTVDSAPAHLAGALGRPVWLLNRHNAEWRWPAGRAGTAWYPTMRIFRQPRLGDWPALLEDVRRELATLAAGSAAAEPDPLALLFAQAAEAHLAGDLYEAEQLYRGIILADPDHADALHALAMIARQTDQLDAAFDLVGQALRLRPDIGEYLDTLGRILLAQGSIEQAVQAHRFAVERNPQSAMLRLGLGHALHAAGWHEAARDAFAQAAALDPQLAQRLRETA